jgi:PEP-CTERM motif
MKKILIVGFMVTAVGSANAATLVYNYGPSTGFNVQMFNPALGTLQSVKTEVTESISFRFTEAQLSLDPGTSGSFDWIGETKGFQYIGFCGGGEPCPFIKVNGMGTFNTDAGPYDIGLTGATTNLWTSTTHLAYFTGTGTRPSNPSFSDPVVVRSYQFGNQVGFGVQSGFNHIGDVISTMRVTYTYMEATVPEPATWLMTIIGFGAAGFALRSGRHRASRLPKAI